MTSPFAFSPLRFLLPVACTLSFAAASQGENARHLQLDFGDASVAAGHRKVSGDTEYKAERGFGWLATEAPLETRERSFPAAPFNDFVFGRSPATFRIDAPAGTYRLTLQAADRSYGDHLLEVRVNGEKNPTLPALAVGRGEIVTLSVAFATSRDFIELQFSSPVDNWIINALTLEPAREPAEPTVGTEKIPVVIEDRWEDVASWPFPAAPHLERFRANLEDMPPVRESGLKAEDYLRLIGGNVEFFRQHQDGRGAIIDPYREVEYQYSTPCFALAGAVLVEFAGRDDLLEAVALAMDWAVRSLARRKAATAHEDFYAPVLAHALPLLARHVSEERVQQWKDQLAAFDPWQVYRSSPGGGNWNLVAASGEALFHLLGIREDVSYVEASLAQQGHVFRSPWGLYLEGPMPYDHFPRLWLADMLAAGYQGEFTERVAEVIRRAAITSLFIQSPAGELPSGGRSAHHQWNEAQQAVTYEVYARQFAAEGDEQLARVFKRAARLALSSMQRWQRPSGELWIVKNRVDPAEAHAFEGYSSHSQYNLLAMAMLAIAHHHALATEDLAEEWAPAEVGGFLIDLRPGLPHVFANASGTYAQINTSPDPAFNAAGLMRIHQAGHNPQLGPSDGPVAGAIYRRPEGPRTTAAVGVAWQDDSGAWHRLAEQPREKIQEVRLRDLQEEREEVTFRLEWRGEFPGINEVVEEYRLTRDGLELAAEVPGYSGPLRWILPLFANDGQRRTAIEAADGAIAVELEGDVRQFFVPGAERLWIGDDEYAYHNGWARIGFAEYPKGGRIELRATFTKE